MGMRAMARPSCVRARIDRVPSPRGFPRCLASSACTWRDLILQLQNLEAHKTGLLMIRAIPVSNCERGPSCCLSEPASKLSPVQQHEVDTPEPGLLALVSRSTPAPI